MGYKTTDKSVYNTNTNILDNHLKLSINTSQRSEINMNLAEPLPILTTLVTSSNPEPPIPTTEIPIWVNGFQRWISGISRKTTCDDVIRLLLKASDINHINHHDNENIKHNYAIVERWHKVERPLDARSRILKVWSTWGDEQSSVKLTLKRINPTTVRDIKSSERHNKDNKKRHKHNRKQLTQTLHPKRLLQEQNIFENTKELTEEQQQTIEKLMKLILVQGETIQQQLKRLNEREEQINRIEHKVHKKRVEKLGSNYLLETYLGSLEQHHHNHNHSKNNENDSGVAENNSNNDESSSSPTINRQNSLEADDEKEDENNEDVLSSSSLNNEDQKPNSLIELRTCISLFEKLVNLNKKLEKQEQYLVKLHVKLRRYTNKDDEEGEGGGGGGDDKNESLTIEENKQLLKEQLEEIVTITDIQEREIESNNMKLNELGNELESKNHILDCLRDQLNFIENEQQHLESLLLANKSPSPIYITKLPNNNNSSNSTNNNKIIDSDSNSDTGLSSLHSSGEEGVYILDTLV